MAKSLYIAEQACVMAPTDNFGYLALIDQSHWVRVWVLHEVLTAKQDLIGIEEDPYHLQPWELGPEDTYQLCRALSDKKLLLYFKKAMKSGNLSVYKTALVKCE